MLPNCYFPLLFPPGNCYCGPLCLTWWQYKTKHGRPFIIWKFPNYTFFEMGGDYHPHMLCFFVGLLPPHKNKSRQRTRIILKRCGKWQENGKTQWRNLGHWNIETTDIEAMDIKKHENMIKIWRNNGFHMLNSKNEQTVSTETRPRQCQKGMPDPQKRNHSLEIGWLRRTLQPEELVQRNNNTVVVHSCHLFTTPPSKIWENPYIPSPNPKATIHGWIPLHMHNVYSIRCFNSMLHLICMGVVQSRVHYNASQHCRYCDGSLESVVDHVGIHLKNICKHACSLHPQMREHRNMREETRDLKANGRLVGSSHGTGHGNHESGAEGFVRGRAGAVSYS